MEPNGTIVFSTVGVSHYGFDVFSIPINSPNPTEVLHTDGVSVNYNAHFLPNSNTTITFVSERSGSPNIYQTKTNTTVPTPLPTIPQSHFHDRPTIANNNTLYFVSNHERNPKQFHGTAAVYSSKLDTSEIKRVTPPLVTDLSPAVSISGEMIAVASYGAGPWKGDFRELKTDIVVFRVSDPSHRRLVSNHGGWPAWCGDDTVYFHRVADDGWWSVYRTDVHKPESEPRRVTPPGLHAFTPAVSGDGKWLAVATRRKGRKTRQIEIFDLETEQFHPVTELVSPEIHHYNPFFSDDSSRLGYHRFRGESDRVIPHLQPVRCPVNGVRMLRTHCTFPSFSPGGDLIAVNGDMQTTTGLMVMNSDGSKRWRLLDEPAVFGTAWSRTEKGAIFVSMGPIFQSLKATVQIARITFDPSNLTDDRDAVPAEVKILTNADTGNNAFPSCSPDGKRIVFRSGRSGHKNLYIIDAVNGESDGGIRRLTDGEWIDTMPAWSPDGELIAFSSNRHNPSNAEGFGVYIVRPDGTELRRVAVAAADTDRERINHVCFSPDGNWLLFTANLAGVSAEPIAMPNQFQAYGDLYICRLDGTDIRRLTYNAYENGTPAWYAGNGVSEIESLSLEEPIGDDKLGKFDEPLWITCEV